MKIQTRIYLGFAVTVGIGLSLAGFSVFQLSGIERQVVSMDHASSSLARVLEIQTEIEAIRRTDIRYRLLAEDSARLEMKDHTRRARTLLTEAAATTLLDDRRRTYDGINQAVIAHEALFDDYAGLLANAAAGRAKLLSVGDELTAATGRLYEAATASGRLDAMKDASIIRGSIFSAQIANWRLLATADSATLAAFKAFLDKASATLTDFQTFALPAEQPLLEPLAAAIASYTTAFNAVLESQARSVLVYETQLKPLSAETQAKLAPAIIALKALYTDGSNTTTGIIASTSSLQKLLACAGLLLGVALAFLIGRSIARPIAAMTSAMRRLAQQDMTVEIPGVGRRDEIGTMAGAVQVFKDNARQAQALEREQADAQGRRLAEDERVRVDAEQSAAAEAAVLVVGSIGMGLQRLAAGDLTFRLDAALPQAYEGLRGDLNAALDELQGLVRSIVTNTSGIQSGVDEITQASDDLSRRTEQQAASLEETAAALDQITATVRKTAQGSKHAHDVVLQTRADAEQSSGIVLQAVAAMGSIEQSSQEISQIIGVIDEIAFQTNLLALNAGVEAARAGDAGRGFAVVASEVRALAQRSAQAAKEIKALISTSTQQVGNGVKLVGETGQALGRIVTQVGEVTTAISEITASAQEQAAGLAEVNTAINQMDQVTQQNAAMVEQSTAASHSLAQETADLVRLTERFQIGDAVEQHRPGSTARPVRKPARAAQRATPVPMLKVVRQDGGGGGSGGGAARAAAVLPAEPEGWTEF